VHRLGCDIDLALQIEPGAVAQDGLHLRHEAAGAIVQDEAWTDLQRSPAALCAAHNHAAGRAAGSRMDGQQQQAAEAAGEGFDQLRQGFSLVDEKRAAAGAR